VPHPSDGDATARDLPIILLSILHQLRQLPPKKQNHRLVDLLVNLNLDELLCHFQLDCNGKLRETVIYLESFIDLNRPSKRILILVKRRILVGNRVLPQRFRFRLIELY